MGVRVGGGGAYVVVFVCRASPRTMTAHPRLKDKKQLRAEYLAFLTAMGYPPYRLSDPPLPSSRPPLPPTIQCGVCDLMGWITGRIRSNSKTRRTIAWSSSPVLTRPLCGSCRSSWKGGTRPVRWRGGGVERALRLPRRLLPPLLLWEGRGRRVGAASLPLSRPTCSV